MAETDDGVDPQPSSGDDDTRQPETREERLANVLERIAYKFHDFGNWLMGFLR